MNDLLNQATRLRQLLHANPELSGQEKNTQATLLKELRQFSPSTLQKVGKTGVLCAYHAKNASKNVLFRCDIDALPIVEDLNISYKSTNNGVSHKCGHDGHSASMFAFAGMIQSFSLKKWNVHLLFQPSEENGKGARMVLTDKSFTLKPDLVFGVHNIPAFPLHQVLVKAGPFTPAVVTAAIHLKGCTSHAAEPEHGNNPAMAVSEIIQSFKKHEKNTPDTEDFRLLTPSQIVLGEEAYGTSAGEASLFYTIRCWQSKDMEGLRDFVVSTARKIAEKTGLQCKFEWIEPFEPNNNSKEAIAIVNKSFKQGRLPHKNINHPFRWGEDFGLFTQKYSGAMLGVGSGEECYALHHPKYNFPDAIIPTIANLYLEIVKTLEAE